MGKDGVVWGDPLRRERNSRIKIADSEEMKQSNAGNNKSRSLAPLGMTALWSECNDRRRNPLPESEIL
jgi:hypothetical protein